jgi:hypothetical protein
MLYLRILFLIAGLCSLQVQTAPVTPTDADRREIYQVVINATVREYADNSKQKIRQVVVSPKTCAEVKANASPEQADVDLHTLLGHMFGDPPMDDPLVVSFIEANRKPQSLPKDPRQRGD